MPPICIAKVKLAATIALAYCDEIQFKAHIYKDHKCSTTVNVNSCQPYQSFYPLTAFHKMAALTLTAARTEVPDFSTVHVTEEDSGEGLLADLEDLHTKPLWAQMKRINPPLPNPTAVPYIWRYEQIRPHLLRAGKVVTEKEAERRVLMLTNPTRGIYIEH